jgi:hypothetical protein
VGNPKDDNTGSGANLAGTTSDVERRAHILNRDAHAQQVSQGPGSLDPKDLEPHPVADARRWLAKHGVEMKIPKGWRFMGQFHDGRSVSFNHSGNFDGHTADVSFWRLPSDVPVDRLLHAYLGEDLEDLVRLGRVSSHEVRVISDVEGLLLVGGGPAAADELASIDPEQLFMATDGTGRRIMSWRGAMKDQLVIVSFSSPVETFFEARPVYDAMLSSLVLAT